MKNHTGYICKKEHLTSVYSRCKVLLFFVHDDPSLLFRCLFRETLIKAFPSPDLRCEAAFSLANLCDPPEIAKEMLI